MSWKQTMARLLADLLRLTIRACLLIDGILLALLSVYFTFRVVLHSIELMNRKMFSSPW